jgi:hypothetical protein
LRNVIVPLCKTGVIIGSILVITIGTLWRTLHCVRGHGTAPDAVLIGCFDGQGCSHCARAAPCP